MNLYAYVGDDPVDSTDPEGLMAESLATGWGIAFAEPSPVGEIVMAGVTVGVLATAGWEAYTHFAKGGKQNVRDTGLSHLPDEVIDQRANDRSLSPGERRRYQKEQKARKKRNKRKRCQ